MDLGALGQQSQMAPVLVRLFDSHRLYTLARSRDSDARMELVGAIVELLETNLSPREKELAADILINLARQAEVDLRRALSERLAGMQEAPLRLVLNLAHDEIQVADAVLRRSPVLSELDLLYLIRGHSAEHWRAIASRPNLPMQVVEVLAESGDVETAQTLIENDQITLTSPAMSSLSGLSVRAEELTIPLLRRPEVTPEIARKLYQAVSEAMQEMIREKFGDGESGSVVAKALHDVVTELKDASTGSYEVTPDIAQAAEHAATRGELNMPTMLEALKRGQIGTFMAQLANLTSLPTETIESALRQPSGQGLALICKAFEIAKADFVSMLLLTQKMRGGEGGVNYGNLNKALMTYDRVGRKAAARILTSGLFDMKH